MNKKELNNYILALYLFQFGFLQPINSIVNSQLPIAVFSLFLLIIALFFNNFKIKNYVLFIVLLTLVLFILSSMIFNISIISNMLLYGEFAAKGLSAFYIASLQFSKNNIYKAFLRVSVLNFLVVFPAPFISFYDSMNYMRYGYALLPSTLFFLSTIFVSKLSNNIYSVLFFISLFVGVIYGSRGPIIAIFIYLLFQLFSNKNLKFSLKIVVILLFFSSYWLINQADFFLKIINYFYIDLNIRTYFLAKMRQTITIGLSEASSGRNFLYNEIFDIWRLNPIFGKGIGSTQLLLSETAHNIILQIMLETGLIGLMVWSIILSMSIKKAFTIKDTYLFNIFIIVFAIAIGRLLVSSDLWLRPELWFMLSLASNEHFKT